MQGIFFSLNGPASESPTFSTFTTARGTADHGNCEMMIDPDTGGPHTAHTTNPVPLLLMDEAFHGRLRPGCSLRDVGPTVLGLLGLERPKVMTGRDLRETA